MIVHKQRIKLTLTEPMLGTLPADKDLATRFYATKHPGYDPETGKLPPEAEEEVRRIPEDLPTDNVGLTVFPRDDDGQPFIYTHMITGLMVAAQEAFNRAGDKLPAYKKVIRQLVSIERREAVVIMPDGRRLDAGELLPTVERSLRVDGPMGSRTALVRSESLPEGTTIEFTLQYLGKKEKGEDTLALVSSWLDYAGIAIGLGQWRNAGFGRFTWELV